MTKARRSFTDEFKREAVALLQTSGRPLMQIANELGIQPSMLRNWRNAVLGVRAGVSQRRNTQAVAPQAGMPDVQSAEMPRLRREVQRLRMERDILKNPRRPLFRLRPEKLMGVLSLAEGSGRLFSGRNGVAALACV
jgi:transposase